MKLSSSDRRLFKTMTTFPWSEDGGPTFYDFANNERSYDPSKFGIARRAIHDDPTEIVRFACLGVRNSLHSYAQSPLHEGYGLWHSCLWALAINDYPAIEMMSDNVSIPADAKHGAYPEYYATISDLLFGLLQANDDHIDNAITRLNPSKLPSADGALVRVLVATANRSPKEFAISLHDRLKCNRRIRYIDPHYKFIDVMAHGLWALSYRVDAATVCKWDTEQPLPWDVGFHEWHVRCEPAESCIDAASLSDDARGALAFPKLKRRHGGTIGATHQSVTLIYSSLTRRVCNTNLFLANASGFH